MRVALVTCADGPDVAEDRDLPVLVRALNEAGVEASAEVWDDAGVDWARFDLAVIRSTWDYSWRAAEFTAWAERCGALTRLANPADVVRWNTDKRYLADLAAAGAPVVETRYLAPGDAVELPDGHEFVVKPASGAGRPVRRPLHPRRARHRRTACAAPARRRVHGDGAAVRAGHRQRRGAGTAVLRRDTAARQQEGARPRSRHPYDQRKTAHPGLTDWTPTTDELAVAQAALAAVPGAPELLYARVDLVDGDDGRPG